MRKKEPRIKRFVVYALSGVVIFLFLFVLTIFMTVFTKELVRLLADKQGDTVEIQTHELTDEQEDWAEIYVNQLLLEMMDDHPVESIRLQLKAGYDRRVRGEYIMVFAGADPTGVVSEFTGAAVAGFENDPNVYLFMYISYLMDLQKQNIEIPEIYEDTLIAIYLHEIFHIVNHPLDSTEYMSEYERVLEEESQTYWDSVENVMIPIISNRYPENGPEDLFGRAIYSYNLSNGDRKSEYWIEFMEFICSYYENNGE